MWKLEKPDKLPQDVYSMCISRVRNLELKAQLEQILPYIVQSSQDYEVAASQARLHTIPTSKNVGQVSKEEMKKIYENGMVKEKSPGRPIYDELLGAPPHGRCPLCGTRIVSTLDHHLPKSDYPTLVVTPSNLVPSCRDCNTAKLAKIPTNSEEETFHPYFDNIQNDLWLCAEVCQTSPASLRFLVNPPTQWAPITAARAQEHFKVFKLGELYGSYAAQEISNIRHYISELFNKTGTSGVQTFLQQLAYSHSHAYINSWKTATYTALASSEWYCNGGFR